jgi:hypothetical protein
LSDLSGRLAAVKADEDYLAVLAMGQRGVLSREQALAAGLTDGALRHRTRRGGPWQRLLPGVYMMSTGQPSRQQREVAAVLYTGPASFVTGPAALHFYRIRGPQPGHVDVLIPQHLQRASRDFVLTHRTRRMPMACSPDLIVRYAMPARAVADTVRGLSSLADARTVVGSAVQQRLCTVDQLATELRDSRPSARALLRSVLAEVADGIRSAPEGELRTLILTSGLPVPLFNPDLYLRGEFLARPDAWWPEAGLAAEVDSKEFHLLPGDWEKTMRRHRRMTAAGILVLHISPGQLRAEPRQLVAEIAAALKAGRPVPGITARQR